MFRSRWRNLLGVLLLLFLGWAAFRLLNPGLSGEGELGFTEWMWERRSLDLLVQMVFVFAGALGIAAILPVGDNDE